MTQPIRVLQVVTHMNRGGLETMLMNYYRHIDRKKVQFDFLVHREARADYDDEIESLNGTIYRLPRLVPWSHSYKMVLDQFFASHKEYRIVHVHQDCLSSVILKSAKKHNIPVRIAHSHSSSQDKDLKYPIKLFYKRFIRKYATDLFACGYDAGRWMFGTTDFTVLNNAIDTNIYQPDIQTAAAARQSLGIRNDTLVLGHVGRFSYPKNHDFLVDIFALVHQWETNSKLLLIGDGQLRTKIEEKVRSLGLSDSVIFTGVRDDVPNLLQAIDVFVFPSLYEGLPITLVEAQASGLPCVISDNIPKDCDLTDLISRVALEASSSLWAEKILLCRNIAHRNTQKEIAKAGFDIIENVHWLQNFYLQRWETR